LSKTFIFPQKLLSENNSNEGDLLAVSNFGCTANTFSHIALAWKTEEMLKVKIYMVIHKKQKKLLRFLSKLPEKGRKIDVMNCQKINMHLNTVHIQFSENAEISAGRRKKELWRL
jgi:hypothetical protein